jgi:hypothetical protein
VWNWSARRPLVEALRRYVTAAGKLHADDAPVPVLAPGQGKTKTGRLWTYVRDDRPAGDTAAPAVWFAYSPDRKGEHPAHQLETYRGTLQADAYAGFIQLYEDGRIQQAACWAHVRWNSDRAQQSSCRLSVFTVGSTSRLLKSRRVRSICRSPEPLL